MAVGASVGQLLGEGSRQLRESGSETPRLDAEVLLGHVLHVDRASLLAHPEAHIGPRQQDAYEESLRRRAVGEPVAYIRGLKEFYGLALSVDPRALIPRPETERLVELGLEHVRRLLTEQPRSSDAAPIRAWDVGTGSGAVAVALAVEARRRGYDSDLRLLASDASSDALALAVENAASHGVADLIDFFPADLLDAAEPLTVELVLANLPYIPSDVVPELPVAASYEPVAALDGGADGLFYIRRLLAQLPSALARGGACLLEIGAEQGDAVLEEAAGRLPGWPARIEPDLAGQPRVVELLRPGRAG